MSTMHAVIIAIGLVIAGVASGEFRAGAQGSSGNGDWTIVNGTGGAAFVANARTGAISFCDVKSCKLVGRGEQ